MSAPAYSRTWLHRLHCILAGLCLGVVVTISGCGLVGGEDDGDEDYPEPPGRPNAAMVDQSR